jgi:glycosyltransferase involved in cell wall biosynthesis
MTRRIHSVMIGLGGPVFITEWAKAVSRYAHVSGIKVGPRLPRDAEPVGPGMALGRISGFDVVFVRRTKLRPTRFMWRLNATLGARALRPAISVLAETHGNVDIIHTHFYSTAASTPKLARDLGIPFVHTEHSSNLAAPNSRSLLSVPGERILRHVMSSAAKVMVVGREQQETLRLLGIEVPVIAIGNPVDTRLFFPETASPLSRHRLLAVGSLIPRKRHDLLLRAFAIAHRRTPELRLEIVGLGPEEDKLRNLAETLSVGEAVRFQGKVTNAQVGEIMRSSDMLVHAATHESFGVAIAEAWLCGLPVVTTQCGGVVNDLWAGAGVIVENDDPARFATSIEAVLEGSAIASAVDIAEVARERYGSESVGRRIEAVYREVSTP